MNSVRVCCGDTVVGNTLMSVCYILK